MRLKMKIKKKSLSKEKKKTWSACSQYTRLKHADKNGYCICYTCRAKLYWKEIQAGHGFSGRNNSILFEEDIIRPQCYGCNICNSGRLDVFTRNLRKELGEKRFEELW